MGGRDIDDLVYFGVEYCHYVCLLVLRVWHNYFHSGLHLCLAGDHPHGDLSRPARGAFYVSQAQQKYLTRNASTVFWWSPKNPAVS